MGKGGPQDLDLPVRVFSSSNDSVLVKIVLIRNGFVLRFVLVQAVCNVDLDLRYKFLDSRFNSGKVFRFDGSDESVAGVGHVLVRLPALSH